jgi:hypothetical protein
MGKSHQNIIKEKYVINQLCYAKSMLAAILFLNGS